MLHIINSVEPEAWAAILSGLGAIIGAVLVARKGSKKTPPEVGSMPPVDDRTEYVLREIRQTKASVVQIDERVTEIDRRTEAILLDTRILVDRR